MTDIDRVKRQKAIVIIKSERRKHIGDGLLRDLDQCSSGELFSHLLRRGYVWARNQNNFMKQLGLPLGGMMEKLKLEMIRLDGGTQSRAMVSDETVNDYADAMREGAQFPPIVVFHDGANYWLADGFHRVAAAKKAELTEIPADVRQGDQRVAVLTSVSVNANHGLRRTQADKRRAIETLLRDDEWRQWSDREISRRVSVDHKTVGNVRADLVRRGEIPTLEFVKAQRGDTEFTVTKSSYPPGPAEELDVEAARQASLEIILLAKDRDHLREWLETRRTGTRPSQVKYWLGMNTAEVNGETVKIGKNHVAVELSTVNGTGVYKFDALQLWDWAQERANLANDIEVVKTLIRLLTERTFWADDKIKKKLLKYGLALLPENSNYLIITGSGRTFIEDILRSRPMLAAEREAKAHGTGYLIPGDGEKSLIALYDAQKKSNSWVSAGHLYYSSTAWVDAFAKCGYVDVITRESPVTKSSKKPVQTPFYAITEKGCALMGREVLPEPPALPDLPYHPQAGIFVPPDAVFSVQIGEKVKTDRGVIGTVEKLDVWPELTIRRETSYSSWTEATYDNQVTAFKPIEEFQPEFATQPATSAQSTVPTLPDPDDDEDTNEDVFREVMSSIEMAQDELAEAQGEAEFVAGILGLLEAAKMHLARRLQLAKEVPA